jgi:argininosuccinate synthase
LLCAPRVSGWKWGAALGAELGCGLVLVGRVAAFGTGKIGFGAFGAAVGAKLAAVVFMAAVGADPGSGVYENPAGAILYHTHRVLESLTLDRDLQHFQDTVGHELAKLIYVGQWFSPLRESISAFLEVSQANVTGEVKIKLYKGNIINAGVTSPYSLYDEAIVSFDDAKSYTHADATGYIKLYTLPTMIRAKMQDKHKE